MPDTPESVRDHLGNAALFLTTVLHPLACAKDADYRAAIQDARARLDRAEAALEQERNHG